MDHGLMSVLSLSIDSVLEDTTLLAMVLELACQPSTPCPCHDRNIEYQSSLVPLISSDLYMDTFGHGFGKMHNGEAMA